MMFQNIDWKKVGIATVLFQLVILMVSGAFLFDHSGSYKFEFVANMAIDFFGMCICILVVLTLMQERFLDKSTRLFHTLIALLFFNFLFELMGTYSESEGLGSFLILSINYLDHVLLQLQVWVYWYYVRSTLPADESVLKKYDNFCWIMLFAGLLILASNTVFHELFSVKNGEYILEDAYYVQYVCPAAILLSCVHAVKNYNISRRSRVAFYSVILLPFSVTLITTVATEYYLLYLSILFAHLIVYGNFYVVRSNALTMKDAELTQQRASILVSQIQPHFLYNSLTSIMNIKGNPVETKDAIADFGKFMRGNLDTLSQKAPIPLMKEIDHMETYVELANLSRKNPVKIVRRLKVRNMLVPALTLQVIAQNCMDLGFRDRSRAGTIIVESDEVDGAFVLTVTDDGEGFDVRLLDEEDDSEVFGISQIRARIHDMIQGVLDVESTKGIGTIVTIVIPRSKEN